MKNYLKDEKHVIEPEYPISVILELVNRCNLECTFAIRVTVMILQNQQ